ncbi:MAG TPA: lysylphosphatidylglycerol synthase transmembrane domain-containing protein [Chthoniobacterales bacterium]|nr:lysylphosphatidylglycerol synthase transmembrane domain-containing protein [Chthoniobacterales bacterium]
MSGKRLLYLKICVTLILLGALIWRVDFGKVLRALDQFSARIWIAGGCIYFLSWVIASVKWRVLAPTIAFRKLLTLNLVGQYYSTLLPGQIAGEAVKAYRLGKGRGDAEALAASVVVDKLTGLAALVLVAAGGLFATGTAINPPVLWFFAAFAMVFGVAIFWIQSGWAPRSLRSIASRLGTFVPRAEKVWDSSRRYLRDPIALAGSTIVGIGVQLCAILINFLFSRQLGLTVSFMDWCWLFALISLIGMLPFTIAGLGLREASFVGVMALAGVSAEKALAMSLAIFSLLLAGAVVGGVLEFCRRSEPVRAAPAWTS